MAFPSNKFFAESKVPPNSIPGVNLVSKNVPYLSPTGANSNIDIVNDFYWSNPIDDTSEIPYIIATEYELQYGTWTQNLANALTLASNIANLSNTDPYLSLYAANPTGFSYAFPWLLNSENSKIRSTQNNWTKASGLGDLISSFGSKDSDNKKSGLAGALLGGALGLVSPGFGFEETYQYSDTTLQSITIKFPLYNTIDTKSAFDNYCFVTLFNFQNLKNRTSFVTYIPPKIYTLDAYAYGGIYWPVAYVSDFSIDSIGTTRYLTDYNANTNGNPLLVPEAYKVSITFKQLLSDSSNIFAGTMGGTKIQVANPLILSQEMKKDGIAALQSLQNISTGLGAGVGVNKFAPSSPKSPK